MRKNVFPLFLLFIGTLTLVAQVATSNKGMIPSHYDRNALTVLILDNNGAYIHDIKNATGSLAIPEKYDDNSQNVKWLASESNQNQILQAIDRSKLANKIMASLFSRSSNGDFDMTLIGKRGLYNATVEEMMKASASKIGLNKIKDTGRSLVNNSYIQVIDLRNVVSMQEYYDAQDAANRKSAAYAGTVFKPVDRTQNGWKGDVLSYLYRIEPSNVDSLYDKMWIYSDDNNAVREYKKTLFDNSKFGFSYVTSVKSQANGTQYNPGQLLAPTVQLGREALFSKLLNSALISALYEIETNYEPFRVKTSVYAVQPIRAKIGTKEGLAVDQRFFVLENMQNSKGETTSQRKGVVFVAKVENNSIVATTATTEQSRFYQTAGKKLEPGMTMQQRNDIGLGLSAGYGSLIGGMSGFYLKAEENIATLSHFVPGNSKNMIKITQLKAFFSAAFDAGNYGGYDYSFTRMQFGISKGFYFLRNFSVAPFVSYGVEAAKSPNWTDDTSVNTAFLNIGAYATVNILYNLQAVGTLNLYNLVGNAYQKVGDVTSDYAHTYDYYFNGRSGLAIEVGIRYEL
ncbi:MAG: hypothetical protein WCG08_04205 [Paludibacter sp.]|jgi:hypothetical protein